MDAILAGEKKIFTTLGIKEGGVSAIALDEGGMADSKCLIADHPMRQDARGRRPDRRRHAEAHRS
ncbi:MAG: hypothetical protein M9905_04275 [Rhizobiaceae bacterium]|nr:hypothetical protein [Rhizobiaceae bacterium]